MTYRNSKIYYSYRPAAVVRQELAPQGLAGDVLGQLLQRAPEDEAGGAEREVHALQNKITN